MTTGAKKYYLILISLFLLALQPVGCFSEKGIETEKLYFEPPARLINDYTGMIEDVAVNWAWSELGFRFGNYRGITVKPVMNLTPIDDRGIASKVYQGMVSWFDAAEIPPSDHGDLVCESAIVNLKLTRGFWKKMNPFNEDNNDYLLEIEVVIIDANSTRILCKLRHGAVAADPDELKNRIITGLTGYFDSRK